MQSNIAWAKAADYASRADEAFDDNARHLFLTLCQSWTRMARSWEEAERVHRPSDLDRLHAPSR